MSQRLIFHIGDFKTGTSAVQHWMASGASAVRGVYPCPVNPHDLAHHIRDPELADFAFAQLAQSITGQNAPILISSEHFEAVDPAQLDALLLRHLPHLRDDAMVVVYLRPHAPSLVARFSESTKIGSFLGNLPEYLDWKPSFWRLHMAARLAPWQRVFGARLHLRLYDRRLFMAGDIRHDLLRLILGRAGPPLRPIAVNRTPSLKALSALALFHQNLKAHAPREGGRFDTHARMVGRYLGNVIGGSPRFAGPRPYCDRDSAARLWSGYRADARALDGHFAGAPFTLALEEAVETAAKQPPFDLTPHHWLSHYEINDLKNLAAQIAARLGDEDQVFSLTHALAQFDSGAADPALLRLA